MAESRLIRATPTTVRGLAAGLALALMACGSAGEPASSTLVAADGAGLTSVVPETFRRACERFAPPLDLTGPACPTVVPTGRLSIESAGPLDRSKRHRTTFHLDLASPSLGRNSAGGHWTIVAARGATARSTLRAMLRGRCRRTQAEAETVTVCRVDSYARGGGYYGGHAAVAWADGDVMFHITAHGYANESRVLEMMASLIRERRPIGQAP